MGDGRRTQRRLGRLAKPNAQGTTKSKIYQPIGASQQRIKHIAARARHQGYPRHERAPMCACGSRTQTLTCEAIPGVHVRECDRALRGWARVRVGLVLPLMPWP